MWTWDLIFSCIVHEKWLVHCIALHKSCTEDITSRFLLEGISVNTKCSLRDGFTWSCSRNGCKNNPCYDSFLCRWGFFFAGTHVGEIFSVISLSFIVGLVICPWSIWSTHWIWTHTLWVVSVMSIHLQWSDIRLFGPWHSLCNRIIEIDEGTFGKRNFTRSEMVRVIG